MPQWTKDQLEAIENRGSTLLVSAAAGSGKTAVLVERVLRKIMDTEHPVDIDHLLLVTFTNAAASEMRGRIGAALSEAVAANPDNARLRRQLFLVHRAKITTVHSLCLSLVREQAAELGIAPDFRLMDENEGMILRSSVLEEVIDAAYERGDSNFHALCDLVNSEKDDSGLGKVILNAWEQIQSHPDPRAFLEEVREWLDAKDMNQLPHAQVLLSQAEAATEHGLEFLRMAVSKMSGIEQLEEKYQPAFESDIEQAENLLKALKSTGKDWDACVNAAQSIRHDSLKRMSKEFTDDALKELLKAMRKEWKNLAETIKTKWLAIKSSETAEDRAITCPALSALIDMINSFDDAFSNAKRARNAADFGDLEHFAVRLLYDKDDNKEPSELARTLSMEYEEIAVDEYQDTNAVQHAIFHALSKGDANLFMVGDVKQSIYSFRLADPSIFLEKYNSFADVEKAEQGKPRRVILGQNFRSRSEVLESCNYIFSAVMGKTVGGMDYTDRESLHTGAEYPDANNPRYKTEVLLIDTAKMGGNDDDAPSKTETEARLVAKRVRELLDDKFPVLDKATGELRPVTPDDIVILLRAPGPRAWAYIDALEKVGVNAASGERKGLLESSEVGTIVSMLSVIDNPRQDVDLIGVMLSPLFGFTEKELAEIRLNSKEKSYYDAVSYAASRSGNLKTAEDALDEEKGPINTENIPDKNGITVSPKTASKAAGFMNQLIHFRNFACDQPVFRLIWEIYDQTKALGMYGALPNGAQRQANLIEFFERARAFENQGFRGLFAFVRLLRGMQETGKDFQTVGTKLGGGAVRIMSIHQSKGLEFPVVVLANCAGGFNQSDLKEPVLVHKSLGFGSKCRNLERGIQYDTVERIATNILKRREMVSEELRILYVALTRAKEKLILTGATSYLKANLNKWAQLAELDTIPQYAMGVVNSFLPWIMTPLLRSSCTRELQEKYELDVSTHGTGCDTFEVHLYTPDMLPVPESDTPLYFDEPKTDGYEVKPYLYYPNAYLTEIPSKRTPTQTGQDFNSGKPADELTEESSREWRYVQMRTPLFEKNKKKLTPAEVGIAHHLFVQYCDFSAASEPGGVQKELNRLREKQLLTPEQAGAINTGSIETFFASETYQKLVAHNKVRREFKFSVLAPAAKYYPVAAETPDETVLLQGVIDCLIETPEGLVILDFKTDHISLKKLAERSEEYRVQLDAYAFAAEQIFERPVIKRILYYLSLGRAWELSNQGK